MYISNIGFTYIFRILLAILVSFSEICSAQGLTLVYPNLKAPYDQIFNQIKDGIESSFDGEVTELKLPTEFDPQDIANKIQTQKVIALGKGGWMLARHIYQSKAVAVGALPIQPNDVSGVSMITSPASLFSSLKQLAPKVKTIVVLYSKNSTWNIEEAKKDAAKQGYRLRTIMVQNIEQAVKAYDTIFEDKSLTEQAIWLPLDPITANEKVIIPVILEKAWSNKVVVFSSKPNHARRGALFSAVPDNELLGKALVKLVNQLAEKNTSVVEPIKDIKLAVNLRTAAHLGFNYTSNQKSDFALTFPD